MGFKDFFRKKNNESGAPAAAPASINELLSVSTADIMYHRAVSAANQMMADQIATGHDVGMPAEQRNWFIEHAGQAVNPTAAFGMTWYAHQDDGRMQLVEHAMLEATNMVEPANQPGIQLLVAQRPNAGSPAMLARKDRSNAELRERGAAINEGLPNIEDASQVELRPSREAAERAVCLMAVAIKAEVFNEGDVVAFHPTLQDIIASHGIEQTLSPNEQAFVNDMAPTQHTATQFIWRYEGLWTLLWALGFIDELDYPTAICDVPRAVGIIRDLGPEGFFAAAQIRPVDELLDAADFIYRLHWAVRSAQLGSSNPVPGVEPGAVMERHQTLNWLIGHGPDWDNVDTST